MAAETGRKRLTAEQRRAAILDAALEVFAERGYHASSIDDIARAAGISKALIYEHFASKQALHADLLEHQAGELFGRLAAAVERVEVESAAARLEAGSTPSSASSRSAATPGACCSARRPIRRQPRSSTGSSPRSRPWWPR
jgi:AcrR family transcriptional regulator